MSNFVSRRQFLAAGAVGLCGLARAEAVDPLAELVGLEVRLAEWVRQQRERILQAPPDGKGDAIPWSDYGFKWPAYTLAHLWSWKHPANPLHGADWCLALALELYDKEVSGWKHRGGKGINTYETPHYVCAYLLATLGERIDALRRQRWLEHEETWVRQALTRPLGQTGRYHDSWRFTALYQLGKVLNQPKWSERGVELFHEMLKLQTADGFWLEQRGPSFRYHGLMLPSLAWMYRWTGEAAFRASAERLIRFLTTYVYPDAMSVGPFDVRNINVMAYFPTCPGLELTPEGRIYAARACGLWRDLDMFRDLRHTMVCTRDLGRAAFYVADTVRYLDQYAAKPEQSADDTGKLAIDRDGVWQQHHERFDGLLVRKGAWVLALSGHNPEAFRTAKSPYMLEGASRIELWHEKARLVLGGGHSHRNAPVPLANFFLAGDGGGEFGKPEAGLARPARIACYLPTEVFARIVDGVPELTQKLERGRVRFRFFIKDDRQVEITADWEVQDVRRLCLQMPLVVWRGSEVLLDGSKQSGNADQPRTVRKEVQLRGGPFAASSTLRLPEGAAGRVHWPLTTGQFHDQPWLEDPIRNPYDVALASCQWEAPAKSGKASFGVVLG